MTRKVKPIAHRLFSKIKEDKNGCWIWQGTKNGAGYGTIGLGRKSEGKGFAHRVSYEIFVGPIPEGQLVCHRCDVKLCVNPTHLFCGTHNENMQDMVHKGRSNKGDSWWTPDRKSGRCTCKGEKHGCSKLRRSQVLEIRKLFDSGGWNKSQLARRFGVSRAMVRNIVNGKNWSHI